MVRGRPLTHSASSVFPLNELALPPGCTRESRPSTRNNAALRPKLVPLNRVPRALAGAKQRLQPYPACHQRQRRLCGPDRRRKFTRNHILDVRKCEPGAQRWLVRGRAWASASSSARTALYLPLSVDPTRALTHAAQPEAFARVMLGSVLHSNTVVSDGLLVRQHVGEPGSR